MMNRRMVLSAGLAAPLACFAEEPKGVNMKPYIEVKPVPGEDRNVRIFFSPACTYSRMYLQFFKNLAATLPENRTFIYTPLVNRVDGVSYALAFAAVQRFYPKFVTNFVEASMIGVQDRKLSTLSWAGIEQIGKASRLPVSLARLVGQNLPQLEEDVNFLVALRHNLQVINTPAVAVVGTYVVTPEFTKGDAQLFSQLTNAVISMAL